MTPEQEYLQCYKRMAEICAEQEWGDPFSYARSKEIYAAIALGHKVANSYSGPDAFNQQGEPLEYKSTIQDRVKGSYTGISVQPTWKKQEEYLREEKIAKYPQHYYNRFDWGELVECWTLPGDKVFDILVPKLKKKFPNALKKKDPRLSANVSNTEIKKYGRRVI